MNVQWEQVPSLNSRQLDRLYLSILSKLHPAPITSDHFSRLPPNLPSDLTEQIAVQKRTDPSTVRYLVLV